MEDLKFICPCHCTSHKKDIKDLFTDSYSECGVGRKIDLNSI